MKKIIGIICLVGLLHVNAQEKQKVHSIIVEHHEIGWYETQLELWGKETKKNSKNGEAWLNYYGACRALKNSYWKDDDKREKYTKMGDEIALEAYKKIPKSFEANYVMYWNGYLGQKEDKYLMKAYELQPDDPRVLLDMLIKTEVERDLSTFAEVAKKIYEINRMSPGALNWAYNVLTECKENAILITAGDNDTYAVWIVQQALGYRKDVKVMNAYMIRMDDYRDKLFEELSIEKYVHDSTSGDFNPMFEHLFKNSKKLPVHISGSGIGLFNEAPFYDNLYLTGLTYVYSETNVENIALIKKHFEKQFLLDHLQVTFSSSLGDLDTRIKHLYLPGMIKLYKHYKKADDLEGMSKFLPLIRQISKELKMEEEVNNMLVE